VLTCSRCKTEKSEDDFPRDRQRKTGRYSWCRDCVRRDNRKAYFAREGIALEDVEQLMAAQEMCEACGALENLRPDHCHDSKTLRGVLCDSCNMALGLLQNSAERLEGLLRYVKKSKEG
jgi:Autographiviridae endonuclease VII